MSSSNDARLVVTIGDPAGIGPEVVLKALADAQIRNNCQLTVIGSRQVLQETYCRCEQGLKFSGKNIGEILAHPDSLDILDIPPTAEIMVGIGNRASGATSFSYMEKAIALTLAGKFQGIVTGPISKAGWQSAGHAYPGQTELLAEKAGVKRFGMLFVARSPHTGWTLRTLLATTHIPLNQVSNTLTPELLTIKLGLLVECLQQDFGINKPKIVIAGLNPHSGENGQLGREEKDWLIPWIKAESDRNADVTLIGPIPPDTMWVKPGQAWFNSSNNAADGYLALYHDQGLIPVKLMAFDRAVNTTIGLPFIRTSPDHGTAFDIAGQGIADAASMKAALQFATELAKQRNVI